jgi:hypothetical protein
MPDVTIKMSNGMITSANYVLQQKEIKGRKEMRDHKRVMNALVEHCTEEKDGQKVVKEGPLTMEKGDWETLYAYAEEKVKAGFPASLNDGMCDLMDKIESIAKVNAEEDEKEPATPAKPAPKK